MWAFATGYDGKEFNYGGSQPIIANSFKVGESKIAVGSGSDSVQAIDVSLKSQLALLNVDTIACNLSDADIASVTFTAQAGAGVAVGNWNEWGIYDREGGILFNRKVEAMRRMNC